jgi:hypothetical protein
MAPYRAATICVNDVTLSWNCITLYAFNTPTFAL